ncbi:MAG: hypothetical protein VZQ98_09730 [Bacteroidales bacterium]|nr:hypothetical protein [Bacteroidales bacterium]
MIYKNTIKDMLENKVNEIFLEFQKELNILSGDIEPMDAVNLDNSMDALVESIYAVLVNQWRCADTARNRLQGVLDAIRKDASNAIKSDDFSKLKSVTIEYDGVKAILPIQESCDLTSSVDCGLASMIRCIDEKQNLSPLESLKSKLVDVQNSLDSDTIKALDTDDFSNIKTFTVNYKGIKASIPVEFAEYNNCIQGMLKELIEIVDDEELDVRG